MRAKVDMQTIVYDRFRLVTGSLFTLIFCPIFGLVLCAFGGFGVVVGILLLIGGPLVALGMIRKLLGDATAIRYDQRTVTVFTIWKSHSLSWADVKSVDILVLTTHMYGFIPIKRTYFLDFKVKGGLLGTKKLRLPLKLLGLDKEAGAALVAELDRARLGAPHLPLTSAYGSDAHFQTRPKGRDPLEGAPRDDAFDPDAVMARYMARRAQAAVQPESEPQVAPTRAAGFGRKGL
jgi:hypothetical protein